VLALAAVLLVAAAVAGVALLSGGDDRDDAARRAKPTAPTRTTEARGPSAAITAPAAAVRDFYKRAASDDTDGAWALASPALRDQLGPRERFDATFSTLESIRFGRLEVTDQGATTATVAIRTVARHPDRTDRCQGTVETVRPRERWLVDRLGVACESG